MLVNLTPEGRTIFRLPNKRITVWYFLKDGSEKDVSAEADTILIEPDKGHFTITWRASMPLRKSLFEVDFALIVESDEDLEKLRSTDEISFPLTDWSGETIKFDRREKLDRRFDRRKKWDRRQLD